MSSSSNNNNKPPNDDLLMAAVATVVAVVVVWTITRTVVTTFVSRLYLKFLLFRCQQQQQPPSMVVTGLFIHPVKSLRAVSLPLVEMDDKGFVGDRRFMVVYPLPSKDSTHRFLTQRQCPLLATVVATLEPTDLVLECAGTTIRIPIQQPQQERKRFLAGIWDDQVSVEDMGDDAAAFLQAIVNRSSDCKMGDEGDVDATDSNSSPLQYPNIRLVQHSLDDDRRRTHPKYTPPVARSMFGNKPPPVSLTDGFPILIACQASLDDLNQRLVAAGQSPIPMSRFRPNIVIAGGKFAFDEDRWKTIAIGDQLFAIVKACPRCKQSCTDQQTGTVSTEPVASMKPFRALGNKGVDVFFAQNAIPLGRGTIRVGDPVRVLQRGDPVYC